MKQKFKVEGNEIVRARWEDDEGRTEIHLEREWKKMIEQIYEIPAPENIGDLPRRLILAVPKKRHY